MARRTVGARLQLVVDPTTGEVLEHAGCVRCAEYEVQLQMKERELRGYALRLARAEGDLRHLQGIEPQAEDVRAVLSHWATRVTEEGWWSVEPKYKPGDERWSAVRARLRDEYAVDYCCIAVEGALMQPKSQVKREWLDAKCLFRNGANLERAYERAQDPRLERVLGLKALPPELVGLNLGYLADHCDCGHLRLEHAPSRPEDGEQPCHRCRCSDFDDIHQRADEFIAKQMA